MQDVSRPHDFERSDADPRLIGALALGIAVFLVGVPFLVLISYPDAHRLGRIPDNLPQPPAPVCKSRRRLTWSACTRAKMSCSPRSAGSTKRKA